MFPCADIRFCCVLSSHVYRELSGLLFCNNERLKSHLQLSKNKHNGCSLYLSNVLAEFRFSTSKDSKLQGRSPVIRPLKSTEERRLIHCLTKSGNQRVQYRRKRIDPRYQVYILRQLKGWSANHPQLQRTTLLCQSGRRVPKSSCTLPTPIFLPFLAQTPSEQNLNSRSHS